jgi:hypothetical protein
MRRNASKPNQKARRHSTAACFVHKLRLQLVGDSTVRGVRDHNPEPIRRLLNEFVTIDFHSKHRSFNAEKYSQNDSESLFAGFLVFV